MKKYFDNIYCINLNKRTDRWQESLLEFAKIGIKNKVERFSAIEHNIGISGCTRSHYELIKLAKCRGEKNILIFEDDVEFVRLDIWGLFDKSINQLTNQNLNYELFYFGGNIKDKNAVLKVNDNLLKLECIKTTHCYAINSSIFDIIIDYYKKVDWGNKENWMHYNIDRLNIDWFYYNKIQPRGKTYGIYPGVCQQRLSYSDLVKTTSGSNLWTVEKHYNSQVQL